MKKISVITGATGGMGSAFAKQLAQRSYQLVLVDINRAKLNKLAQELRTSYKIDVEILVANLAVTKSVKQLADELASRKRVDMFVHAAGYGEKTFFGKEDIRKSLDMISVHVLSAVQLIHALLPAMLRRKKGAVVVLSSLASFIPAPGSSIYSATKSFINTFLESLHMEVHTKGIHVQSLCPGLTHTGFHTDADIKRFEGIGGLDMWMEADEVAEISLAALDDGKVICIPGLINKSLKATAGVLPRKSYYALAEKLYLKTKS